MEVKLRKLALTDEQIRRYRLPRDERGRVELDALEAYRPGELAALVRNAVAPYIDSTIAGRLASAESDASEAAAERWRERMPPFVKEAAALRKQINAAIKPHRRAAAKLEARFKKSMAKFRKPLECLSADVERALSESPELPERPEPREAAEDAEQWLFDSSRSYWQQLGSYNVWKAGQTS